MFKLAASKISTWLIIVAILLSAGLYISYKNARIVANEIVQPAMGELYYYNTSFIPFEYNGQKVGPSWHISYEPKEQMVVAPLSVQVSLFGKVIKTTPKDLRMRLLNRSKKE
ncbi:hypothetical protein D1BOALGB6SA_8940 [Olavius sp. associated proteobacterium Delta 1]|nr:hypothetical protein D1BOALGB6SA_8940 [Olavius sp. associated proteobacterium Delta 1]